MKTIDKIKGVGLLILICVFIYVISENKRLKDDNQRLSENLFSSQKSVSSLVLDKKELSKLIEESEQSHLTTIDSLMEVHNITLGQLDKASNQKIIYRNSDPVIINNSIPLNVAQVDNSIPLNVTQVDNFDGCSGVTQVDFFDGCWGVKGSIRNNQLRTTERLCSQEVTIIDYTKRKPIKWLFNLRLGPKEADFILDSPCGEVTIKEYIKK